MKLKILKRISDFLKKLKGKKKQREASVVVVALEENKIVRLNDFPPAKTSGSSQKETELNPEYFIQFDRPLVIRRKKTPGKNPKKIRGLPPKSHYVKALWSNKGPLGLEND